MRQSAHDAQGNQLATVQRTANNWHRHINPEKNLSINIVMLMSV